MSPLRENTVVVTRTALYDHRGEIVPRGSLGTIVMVRVARTGRADDTYEVELFGEGGRGLRFFTATSHDLEVLSAPRHEESAAYA